jgi:SM-20-related protein
MSLPREILRIGEDLLRNGYSVYESFLDPAATNDLRKEAQLLYLQKKFHKAGVGRGVQHSIKDEIRSDEVLWFEKNELLPAQAALWDCLEELRYALNQTLFLGLWDFEGHFALYPEGGFYKKHLDRFQSSDLRTISVVVYLNENWSPDDGGELEIFSGTSRVIIEPKGGTLVCFLSDSIEHQVLESRAPRLSFAGWFKRR